MFVEAEADCSIEDIGDTTKPDPHTLGKLVYDIPGATNILQMPPLVAQVSRLPLYLLPPYIQTLVTKFKWFRQCYNVAGD